MKKKTVDNLNAVVLHKVCQKKFLDCALRLRP